MAGVDKKAVGKRVRDRRKSIGLSQAALAKAVGMQQQGIYNIEAGIVARPRNLLELAAALETTPEWIMRGIGVEVVAPKNAVEEIAALAHDIPPERQGAAIEYLRALRSRADEDVG